MLLRAELRFLSNERNTSMIILYEQEAQFLWFVLIAMTLNTEFHA